MTDMYVHKIKENSTLEKNAGILKRKKTKIVQDAVHV